jgi:hypothetical protein
MKKKNEINLFLVEGETFRNYWKGARPRVRLDKLVDVDVDVVCVCR